MSPRRLLALLLVGLAFPTGLGLAVYVASGSTFVSPAATARVPTGTIGRPSTPPLTTDEDRSETDREGRCDEEEHRADPDCVSQATTPADTTTTVETTTTDETTTERDKTTSDDRDSGSSGSGSSGSGDTGRDSSSDRSGSDGDD